VKSNLRFLSIFLLLVIPYLTACTQTVDIHFNSDESWKVKSHLNFSAQEKILFRGVLQDFLMEITQEAVPSQILQVDDWPAPAFDLLKAYYANEGIEFRWQKLFNSYNMEAKGRNLEQFESLFPGAIAIEKLEDDHYHLNINLGEFNMFAAMAYKQIITFHGSEIINSNAPKQTSNTAVWNNPSEIDVTFKVGDSVPSWAIGLVIFLVLLIFVGLLVKIRSSRNSESQYIE